MNNFNYEKDIKVLCVSVKSFPDGIQEAFDTLFSKVNGSGRTVYGISHGTKDGKIIYKAAVSELSSGEAELYNFESFIIQSGAYLGKEIKNWKENMSDIGKTFGILLQDPRVKRDDYCLEIYFNETDLHCLVPIM